MNPLKWVKQKVKQFLAGDEPIANPDSPAPMLAAKGPSARDRLAAVFNVKQPTEKELRAQLEKRVAKAKARMFALGRKWFWISTQPIQVTDPKTGEVRTLYKKLTYNVGKNKAKRALRAGLSGKSAKRSYQNTSFSDRWRAATLDRRSSALHSPAKAA